MAKRTRQEKKLADERRKFFYETRVSSINSITISSQSPKIKTIAISENLLLVKDLQKTVMLTAIIIGIQFILFFTLKNHIIKFPGLSY